VLVVGLALAACGSNEAVIDPGDGGEYSVELDPADFVATIDNPWLLFTPGSRWMYEGRYRDKVERIEVVVTNYTRKIMGITATVVRETETVNGELVENTFDWYAQDRDGNVWYLGEDTRAFKIGEMVSTSGSWEAGVLKRLRSVFGCVPGTRGEPRSVKEARSLVHNHVAHHPYPEAQNGA
jgi:hypothetical protein